MLILEPNKANLAVRIFCVVFVTACCFPMINLALQEPNINHIIFWKIKSVHLFYIFVLAVLCFLLLILVSISGIIKIQVDTISKTITLISFFNKRKIETKDIETYFWTSHKNAYKVFNGILLILKNGKSVQLAGQNLKSISVFRDYLDSQNIPCSGERRMKFPFN